MIAQRTALPGASPETARGAGAVQKAACFRRLTLGIMVALAFGSTVAYSASVVAQALAVGPFRGPEGIIAGPDHSLYIAEEGGAGILWRWRWGDAQPTRFCDLSALVDGRGGFLGLGIEGPDLYLAAPSVRGGSLLRVPLRNPRRTGIVASGLGLANGTISDGRWIYVTSTIRKRIYRFDLRRRGGGHPTKDETFQCSIQGPNGLAISPNRKTLYAVHTRFFWLPSQIASYAIPSLSDASRYRHALVAGQADGNVWFRGKLYLCLQHEGQIVQIDPSRLECQRYAPLPPGDEGTIHPASIALIRNPQGELYAAVTDVANATQFDYLCRTLFATALPFHHAIYLVRFKDLFPQTL